MKIIKNLSGNCQLGRSGHSPIAFVLHMSEGSFASSLAWCKDPESSVSYHYLIAETGDIHLLVDPHNTAWHCGVVFKSKWPLLIPLVSPNYYTIGIACAGFASIGPNFKQFFSLGFLLNQLSLIHKIHIDSNSLIPHNLIRTDKICPGAKFNFDALQYVAHLK